jgi:hypothetical protein
VNRLSRAHRVTIPRANFWNLRLVPFADPDLYCPIASELCPRFLAGGWLGVRRDSAGHDHDAVSLRCRSGSLESGKALRVSSTLPQMSPGFADLRLAPDLQLDQPVFKFRHTSEFEVKIKGQPHPLEFLGIDDQLALTASYPSGTLPPSICLFAWKQRSCREFALP